MEEVVWADTLTVFKKQLEIYLMTKGNKIYYIHSDEWCLIGPANHLNAMWQETLNKWITQNDTSKRHLLFLTQEHVLKKVAHRVPRYDVWSKFHVFHQKTSVNTLANTLITQTHSYHLLSYFVFNKFSLMF